MEPLNLQVRLGVLDVLEAYQQGVAGPDLGPCAGPGVRRAGSWPATARPGPAPGSGWPGCGRVRPGSGSGRGRRRTWPSSTSSPSSMRSSATRAEMSELMSTFRVARTLPLAVTVATRSRLPTVSTRTGMRSSREKVMLRVTAIATMATSTTPMKTFIPVRMLLWIPQGYADDGFEVGDGVMIGVDGEEPVAVGCRLDRLGLHPAR